MCAKVVAVMLGVVAAIGANTAVFAQVSPGTYSIASDVSGGVQNLRSGPGLSHSLVVAIPAGADHVTIEQCRPADDGRTRYNWCRAAWRGHRGWISSCCLVSGSEQTESNNSGTHSFYYVADTLPPDAFLALRTEPSGGHGQRIMEMPNGTVLEVIEKRPDNWWFVKVVDTDQKGWALSQQGNRHWIRCCTQANRQSSPDSVDVKAATQKPLIEHQHSQDPQDMPVSSTQIVVIDPENAAAINKRIGDLSGQIATLTKVVGEQSEIQKNASVIVRGSVEQTIAALNKRIEELKNEFNEKDKTFSTYLTSVRPNDRDFYLTARRASESYPKIPYYIPGTKEIGEFWIEPTVTDKGELLFGFKFVDTEASVEKVRGKIDMSRPEIEGVQKALLKLHEWSDKAHSENVRSYEKRVICFPEKECPPDGERIEGKSSTEIRFIVYEDGSTAGRIQRNKGLFVEGYNVSIDSALMLQAYLNHVIKAANSEFISGRRTKKELDEIFK
jgi:uncharacterized protein YraI